jgi:hypothetical protein
LNEKGPDSMIPTNLDLSTARTPPPTTAGRALDGARPLVFERGLRIPDAPNATPADASARVILYERLTGDAARSRATSPEPDGAGLTSEQVARVEYIEVWSTPPPARGYDFRMYSFGGALLASRSTRS